MMKRASAGALVALALALTAAGGIGMVLAHANAAPASSSAAHARCWLPTYDEGYTQNVGDPGAVCVNTGKPITPQDAAAAHYAPQCRTGSHVPCYQPCYAYTAGVPYPWHPVPCSATSSSSSPSSSSTTSSSSARE